MTRLGTVLFCALLTAVLAAGDVRAQRIPCSEQALLGAIADANSAGGGVITFDCRDTAIPMRGGLGTLQGNVVIDGEDRDVTLEFTADFSGCSPGNNGIGGAAIARVRGSGNEIRGLTFRNFLESIQLDGPANIVSGNRFLAHVCSDDGLSSISTRAVGNVVENNHLEGYRDKAFQLSYGGGTIRNNTFVDCQQPFRAPYDNSTGERFSITDNSMTTTGNRGDCTGVTIDGAYVIDFERNTLQCLRGLRLGGTTEIIIRQNYIEGNGRVGIRVGGNAVASIEGNTVIDNGLAAGTLPAGGVVVWESGRADLGGGSLAIGGQTVVSGGGNTLAGNGVADARNLRSGYVLRAEGNCWDHATVAEVQAGDTAGDVDVDPLSTTCGGGGSGPDIPANLRRTDVR